MGHPYVGEEAVAYGRPGGSQSPPQRFSLQTRVPGGSLEHPGSGRQPCFCRDGQEGGRGESQHQKADKGKNEADGKVHLKGLAVGAGYLKSKRNKASGREGK